MSAAEESELGPGGVSTLELFFDLVFVFTITQLTNVLVEEPNLKGLLEVSVNARRDLLDVRGRSRSAAES